jgi:hypothetical protein
MQTNIANNICGAVECEATRMCARKGFAPDQWITRPETADMLGLSFRTLAKKACEGSGPPYQSFFGRSRYRAIDAAMWFLAQQRDPSESPAAKTVQRRRARGDTLGRPRSEAIAA